MLWNSKNFKSLQTTIVLTDEDCSDKKYAHYAMASHRFANPTPAVVQRMLDKIILNGTRTRSSLQIAQPRFVSCITGGGGSFFSYILGKAGASTSFLEGLIPYDKRAGEKVFVGAA